MPAAQTSGAIARTVEPSSDIDPRGPQFNAAITLVVLVVALAMIGSTLSVVLTAAQAALFIWGASAGVSRTPHAAIFRRLIRPRLSAPDHLEDPAPPRFAQAVGAVFAVVALVGLLAGAETVALVALSFATVAATLNAFFRFCLGCEVFLLVKRLTPTR